MSLYGSYRLECFTCAIAYIVEPTLFIQSFAGENPFENVVQPSMHHFFGVGVPKSESKAVDALQTFDFGRYSGLLNYEISNRTYTDINDRISSCNQKHDCIKIATQVLREQYLGSRIK